ncbi:autotransporter assembly complex protein TamA [Croceicoccus hydrothermalis]|uniref:autotransporter assembly complex protein TamA n=1 Tax=Croceicoccus hydrothermalis TaxID=2867964 RepID=UPI001EFC167A|nr:BamA/TamA family outer membrane protein [Croceicoccus hydrothermalis]
MLCASAVWVPSGARAQEADPELEALIPDGAIADAEGWATGADPGSVSEDAADTPIDETGYTLAWPDDERLAIDIEPVAPDPALAEWLDPSGPEIAADLRSADMESDFAGRESDLIGTALSDRITLAYPETFARFGQFENFTTRFLALSTLESLADDDDTLAQVVNRARADQDVLARLLTVYGFYDADIRRELAGRGPGAGKEPAQGTDATDAPSPVDDGSYARFRFVLEPGPRYRLTAIDLGSLGATGTDCAMLRRSFAVEVGDPIDLDAITFERIDLQYALAQNGYPFAEVAEPQLTIDHAVDGGTLSMPVAPGGRYRFGTVTSTDPDFLSGRHLAQIARFESGDTYRGSDVEDLREAILQTGLASTLTVRPRAVVPPTDGEPGTVAIDVDITPAPLRTIAGAIGYGTGQGFRLAASWEHRNFFPPEGMLRLRGIAGTQEQLIGATFRRNNFTGRDRVLTLDLFANTIDRDAYEARTISAIARYERLSTLIFQKRFVWAAGLELVASQEREGALDGNLGPRETYFVVAAPGRIGFDESDDLLDPRRGWRASLLLSPEFSRNNSTGSQGVYARAILDGSFYQPLTDRITGAGRVRFGTITGLGLSDIAPSRRLYAGGGGSVRGYGYQQIGPKDTIGDPTGGRSLTEFALEARVRTGLFDGALSVVPFIDAGAVDTTTTPRFSDLQFGAGVGIRYHTNFGPLRVDLATPINPRPGDGPVAVYVSLGQAF